MLSENKIKQAQFVMDTLLSGMEAAEVFSKELFGIVNLHQGRNLNDFITCMHWARHGRFFTAIPTKTGNDFVDQHGKQVEFKSKEDHLSSYTTSPNLNKDWLNRIRNVDYIIFSNFNGRRLMESHMVTPDKFEEPYFKVWERELDRKEIIRKKFAEGKVRENSIPPELYMNNPKIHQSHIIKHATTITADRNTLDEMFA